MGPSQALNHSVGPHVPYRDKVHYVKWASTSMEGVETVRANEKCIDFELLRYRYGVLYLSSLGFFSIGYQWISIIGVKKKCKVSIEESHRFTPKN